MKKFEKIDDVIKFLSHNADDLEKEAAENKKSVPTSQTFAPFFRAVEFLARELKLLKLGKNGE